MKTLFDDEEVYRRAGSGDDQSRWRIIGGEVQFSSNAGRTWKLHHETPDQIRRSFMKGYIIRENPV